MDGGIELNSADYGDGLPSSKVAFQRRKKVRSIDANVNKDVERLDLGDINRDKATMSIVHQQVTAQRPRRVVINTAGAIRHVPHDEGLDAGAKLRQDVGDCRGEEEQALGHLQGDLFRPRGPDAVDGLGDLEAVV